MPELFPQETPTPLAERVEGRRVRVVRHGLIRAPGRRGPMQPITPDAPPVDWPQSPLYRAAEL